jgi:nitrate reductase alpha subunit
VAQYGLDRGLGGGNVAASYDEDVPYTPAWQERITGVKAEDVITVARQFADNAEKTGGKSMVIIGAAMNHWYHSDMNYRGVINMLLMCGCVGQSGGGWAHYVGQEKLRPQTGWTALAFALGLAPSAAPDELDVVLLRAHRPVALREARGRRDPVARSRIARSGAAA